MSLDYDYVINKRCFEGKVSSRFYAPVLSARLPAFYCLSAIQLCATIYWYVFAVVLEVSAIRDQHGRVRGQPLIERDILFYFRPQWYMVFGCG